MRTWEMIKELTENPNKKFISKHKDKSIASTFAVVEEGGIFFKNPLEKPTALYYIGFDWEWEEVKEPVSFMEAVKSKKDIKVEHENLECNEDFEEYVNLEELLYRLRDNFFSDAIADVLLEGKFYIED